MARRSGGSWFGTFLTRALIVALLVGGFVVYRTYFVSILEKPGTNLDGVIAEAQAFDYSFGVIGRDRTDISGCGIGSCDGCIETVSFDRQSVAGVSVRFDKTLSRFETPEQAQICSERTLSQISTRCFARGYFQLCLSRRVTSTVEADRFYQVFLAM